MITLRELVALAYKCNGWKMFPQDKPPDGHLIIYQNSQKACGVGYHLTCASPEGERYAWKDISYIPLPYLTSVQRMAEWFRYEAEKNPRDKTKTL